MQIDILIDLLPYKSVFPSGIGEVQCQDVVERGSAGGTEVDIYSKMRILGSYIRADQYSLTKRHYKNIYY